MIIRLRKVKIVILAKFGHLSLTELKQLTFNDFSGIAKNLVPVLAALPASSLALSPPGSPKGDRDGGGNHSSGSTTVSATSSPGLDEEPEQSRITINPNIEMSPRKKPRKQQLTGVELTESRCTEEEMQFISEDKLKREIKDEKDKFVDRKHNIAHHNTGQQDFKPAVLKRRPKPSLLGKLVIGCPLPFPFRIFASWGLN